MAVVYSNWYIVIGVLLIVIGVLIALVVLMDKKDRVIISEFKAEQAKAQANIVKKSTAKKSTSAKTNSAATIKKAEPAVSDKTTNPVTPKKSAIKTSVSDKKTK